MKQRRVRRSWLTRWSSDIAHVPIIHRIRRECLVKATISGSSSVDRADMQRLPALEDQLPGTRGYGRIAGFGKSASSVSLLCSRTRASSATSPPTRPGGLISIFDHGCSTTSLLNRTSSASSSRVDGLACGARRRKSRLLHHAPRESFSRGQAQALSRTSTSWPPLPNSTGPVQIDAAADMIRTPRSEPSAAPPRPRSAQRKPAPLPTPEWRRKTDGFGGLEIKLDTADVVCA